MAEVFGYMLPIEPIIYMIGLCTLYLLISSIRVLVIELRKNKKEKIK